MPVADFIEFLENYEILGLAIAFIIGVTVKDLVNSTVDDLIMPLIGIVLPESRWESLTLNVLGAELRIGNFLGVLLEFLIIALLIFLFVRYILRREKVEKI